MTVSGQAGRSWANDARRVADAAGTGDRATLRRLRAELARSSKGTSDARERGVYDGLLGVVDAASDLLVDGGGLAAQTTPIEPGSLAARLLLEIAAGVRGANSDLADRLDTDQWQVSRAGRRLRDLGLATRVRSGRLNGWSLTDAGQHEAARLRGAPA